MKAMHPLAPPVMADRATHAAVVGAFVANMAKDCIFDYIFDVAIVPGGPVRITRAKVGSFLLRRVGILGFFNDSDFTGRHSEVVGVYFIRYTDG
jgi:hypothetical protein